MRILVVDDDPETRQLLRGALQQAAHTVTTVASCAATQLALAANDFDTVVLDVMLPDGSGIELCARLRAAKLHVPILLLTARGDVPSRVSGLEAGADDYLAKPFSIAELQARLKALARRGPMLRDRVVSIGALHVDFEARRVLIDGRALPLTARELAILELLASRRGRVVARDDLLESVWGDAHESSCASLDVLIGRIRRKLGAHAPLLQTIRGVGYVLEERK